MSKKKGEPRLRFKVYCTEKEHHLLKENVKKTTARSFNAYVCAVLFRQDVFLKVRSESVDDFLEVALQLKNMLTDLQKKHTSAFIRLQSLSDIKDIQQWLFIYKDIPKELQEAIRAMGLKMDQIYQRCMQE